MKYWTYLLIIITLLSSSSMAAEKISELVLDNGLRVIVKPDHRSPIAIFQIWYSVGSAYEHKNLFGVSHMLEHLMFKASDNPVLIESFNHLNDIGARGNAYTHRDYTFYYHMLEKRYLETSFRLESERMQGINPSIEDFDIEKKVILEELQLHNTRDPHLLSYDAIYEQTFERSGYQTPIIGRIEDIKQLTLKDTMDWYKKYYTPENATIVVSGDVEQEAVFKLAKKYFSAINKPGPEKSKTIKEKKQDRERRYIMPKTTPVGLILMGYKVPSIKTAMPKWEAYALDVLAGWFESGVDSRLSKTLVRDKQRAYEIKVSFSIMTRQDGLFIIEAIPSQGTSLSELEMFLNKEIELVKNEIINRNTLRKIKNQMVATEIYERDSLYIQAKIIGQAEVIGVHWSEDADYIKRIKSVTPEQIKTVLNKYFIPENKIVIIQNSNNEITRSIDTTQ